MERWVTLDGCYNFRDIGGYATRAGLSTRWGRLFRSDTLGRLTDDAVDRLTGEFGIRTVVDLRTKDEIARLKLPDRLASSYVLLPVENPELDAIRRAGVTGMSELYLWNLAAKRVSFIRLIHLLAEDANLPCVIQCNGGKDRTGIFVALVLELLGVPDETIVEDYVLTDEVRKRMPEQRYDAAVQSLVSAGIDPAILGARRETMTVFLDGFRSAWGSAASYAEAGPDTIRDLHRNLLGPPEIS